MSAVFSGDTLDDVMNDAIRAVLDRGEPIQPSKGSAAELSGVLLEIKNPRARLSRTETRGRAFSCLGELCWYLSASNQLDFIRYYLPEYAEASDDGSTVHGAYGPRLFNWEGRSQWAIVQSVLEKKPDSRQAVLQLFDGKDLIAPHKDIPCTCVLQFLRRGGKLHLLATMRSNDAYKGLPHDVFSFTMMQEIMACALGVDVGTYKHFAGSFHLYDENRGAAERFLGEGFQSTQRAMPTMPQGNPWPSIKIVLEAESALRKGSTLPTDHLQHLDGYWADLIRLLQVFRLGRDQRPDEIRKMVPDLCSDTYRPFIERFLRRLDAGAQ